MQVRNKIIMDILKQKTISVWFRFKHDLIKKNFTQLKQCNQKFYDKVDIFAIRLRSCVNIWFWKSCYQLSDLNVGSQVIFTGTQKVCRSFCLHGNKSICPCTILFLKTYSENL